jgi:hypothetical protein
LENKGHLAQVIDKYGMGREGRCIMTDLLMTFGSLCALGLITALGHRVYQREFNSRCGWCFGSGREWCEEYAPPCKACHGTGVTSSPVNRTQKHEQPPQC